MIIVCSGCEGKMGEKEPLKDKRVSHGICRECLVRIYGPQFAPEEYPRDQPKLSYGDRF